MKIGELARLAGTNVETIRYYERDGLLPVPAAAKATTASMGKPMSSDCSLFGVVAVWT
jgi:hypothetical protein